MKQVLQSLKTGATEVAEVPCPAVGRGQVLIRSTRTLVSTGTERMLVDFGKAGWVSKARQQPDKVRMVIEKARTDGIIPTIEAVRNKLDQAIGLGYCNVGRVLAVGAGVEGLAEGDRVASNGRHAEVVSVPANLCARIPDGVGDDAAAFTVPGAIALQGIRLAQPTLGECVAVVGLGLIGLITVQLLARANGCRVLGIDLDERRLAIARALGAETVNLAAGEDPLAAADRFSRGRGVDAVLITAATSSNEPVRHAARMSRKRGRIVLVGVAGLELSRADFFEKELTFQVSCSYGPGRYDPAYEDKGHDYPVGFVRWTEQRNFEAMLDMMAEGRFDPAPLVTHRFAIADAARAYDLIAGGEPSLGVLLTYPTTDLVPDAVVRKRTINVDRSDVPVDAAGLGRPVSVGVIGAGNYATGVLIPALKAAGAQLETVACAAGMSGLHAARKFGFRTATTDVDAMLASPGIDAVVITTRHDSHAGLIVRALDAGRHVLVEKPLALSLEEIAAVEQAYARAEARGPRLRLMVGFNRRFAPHVMRIKELLGSEPGPISMVMTVNAGAIPASHWTQDPGIGGGRIVGEACHFIDLLRHIAGAPIVSTHASTMQSSTGDTVSIQLGFAGGAIGTIHYFANGNKAFPKERLEVFASGRILQLDNFRRLTGFGWKGFSRSSLWRQDKGQVACAQAFLRGIDEGMPSPIPLEEILEVARVTIAVAEAGRRATSDDGAR